MESGAGWATLFLIPGANAHLQCTLNMYKSQVVGGEILRDFLGGREILGKHDVYGRPLFLGRANWTLKFRECFR